MRIKSFVSQKIPYLSYRIIEKFAQNDIHELTVKSTKCPKTALAGRIDGLLLC